MNESIIQEATSLILASTLVLCFKGALQMQQVLKEGGTLTSSQTARQRRAGSPLLHRAGF